MTNNYNIIKEELKVNILIDCELKPETGVLKQLTEFAKELDGHLQKQSYKHKEYGHNTSKPPEHLKASYDYELDFEFTDRDNANFFCYLVEDYLETIINLNHNMELVTNEN